jgi:RNA polymerase sigma-70 factor (ECF subfamily)
MPGEPAFTDFIRRIRAGDAEAAAELVRQHEPLIRRAVRLQLEDPRLHRLFDSMDICQSVLASFFVRATAGQYDLDRPEQLVKLLVTMARNKLASAARRQHRQRRDQRRSLADGSRALARVADTSPTPSELVAGEELLHRFQAKLTAEERGLAKLRRDGLAWTDIAALMGGTPEGRRIQLRRAIERVSRELGLDDAGHE